MYILSILGVVLSVILMLLSIDGASLEGVVLGLGYVSDVISMILVLIVTIPILASSGLHKDFNNAFKFTLGKKKADSLIELKRAKEAVMLVKRTVILSGVLFFVFDTIIILRNTFETTDTIKDLSRMFQVFCVNETICLISIFYAMVIGLLLLPISSRLEIKMAEFMQE